jgi:hypothetical protein
MQMYVHVFAELFKLYQQVIFLFDKQLYMQMSVLKINSLKRVVCNYLKRYIVILDNKSRYIYKLKYIHLFKHN